MTARYTLAVEIVSPFMFGGAPDLAFGVDDKLPRGPDGRVVLAGTLLRGLLRDALLSMRARGRLPGAAGGADLRKLFGARSGLEAGELKAASPDDGGVGGNAPERGLLVIGDLGSGHESVFYAPFARTDSELTLPWLMPRFSMA